MTKPIKACLPAMLGLPLVLLSACGQPETPSAVVQATESPESPESPEPPVAAPVSAAEEPVIDPDDVWMACYVNGSKVGYTHLSVKAAERDGQPVREYTYGDEMSIQRFGQTTVVRTSLTSSETAAGQLLDFRSEMKTGPGDMIATGSCDGNSLTIVTQSQGRSSKQTIPWQKSWGGFFADQQSLRDQPMKPGETRKITALFPVVNQPIEIEMRAATIEAVRLPTGSKQLLRIDVTANVGQTPLKSILWVDPTGIVWKSRDLLLGMEALLVDREQAVGPIDGAGFDLGSDIVIPVDRKLSRPHETKRIAYRARLPQDEVASLFTVGVNQQIKPVDDETIELTVIAVRPDQPAVVPEGAEVPPVAADKEPGAMIQSDDPKIIAMADKAAGGETDPWALACRFEKFVKGEIHLKNYSTAMATAAEVAESLEGDCTEHAVLLAALCRAKGIPARVAIGLLYYPAESGYAYHMWTEVWINGRWVPMDATLGLGGIGAAHVKFTQSSLQSTAAYAELLPVVRAIGRLKLEILEVE